MTSMHQTHHIQTYSTSSGQNLDQNLDALLDDLQTSVSRPGTSMALASKDIPMLNGGGSFANRQVSLPPGASGYREITTTVTQETNGVPMTSREYQIEYLNPANSVTVAKERSTSPGVEYLKNPDLGTGSHGMKSTYKTESYGYKYESKTSGGRYGGQPTAEEMRLYSVENKPYSQDDSQGRNQSYQFSKTETYRSENATNVSKNLNDLENLLKELNDTPGSQPTMASTPNSVGREDVTARTLDTRSPARYDDSSNTMPKRSSSASREVTYSEVINQRSDRTQSPYVSSGGTPKVQQRTVQREVNTMEQRGHTSRRDVSGGRDRSSEMSPTLRRRTPSPSREFRPSTFSSYPISPKDTQRTVVSKSYNYSSTSRRTPTPSSQSFDEPQPYRSPSPVSFPQKRSPSPVRRSVTRSDSGRNISHQVSPPLSDPNSPTVITYKYTSHSTQHNKYPGGTYDDPDPSATRPFPSVTPVPVEEQNPPKKLDELMASFQDQRQTTSYATEYSTRETERQAVDLQRSPSCERNVRPSEVRISQTYSPSQLAQQQQQQQSPHHSHHHHHRHHHKHHEHHDRHHSHQQQSYQQQQQDNYAQQQYQQYQQYQQQQQQLVQPQTPVNEVITSSGAQTLKSGAGAAANSTKSVAGPPVYYPPGVELFAKKEEAMVEQQQYGGKGKMKSKGKMKYKYESKEKSKEKSGSGVSAVPLCLPVCCAAPCVIM